jgi:hypothetical protein
MLADWVGQFCCADEVTWSLTYPLGYGRLWLATEVLAAGFPLKRQVKHASGGSDEFRGIDLGPSHQRSLEEEIGVPAFGVNDEQPKDIP